MAKFLNVIRKIMTKDMLMFFLFRMSSVFLIRTSFVPDEYWQSLEVAHRSAFGYGYLTWEWTNGIRSYFYPSIFAILFKVLELTGLDSTSALILLPRCLQACLSAVGDYYFVLWCSDLGCTKFWARAAVYTNWFWYFCGSRTIVNSFEMSLTIVALYYYPWNIVELPSGSKYSWQILKNKSIKCFMCSALCCVVRPTAIMIWTPLALYSLGKAYPKYATSLLLQVMIPVGVFMLTLSIIIDSIFYKRLLCTQLNFLEFNFFTNLSGFYGSHSMLWYALQGLPVVLGLYYLPFTIQTCLLIYGSSLTKDNHGKAKSQRLILAVIMLNIAMYSAVPHKEFRFLLAVSPMMMLIGVKYVSAVQSVYKRMLVWKVWMGLTMVHMVVPSLLFGVFHQRGTLSVMEVLAKHAHAHPHNTSYLFLMPCHSTPLYSHIHVNVTTRFLTCEPPLLKHVQDESEEFYNNPKHWLDTHWDNIRPTHVILFDTLAPILHQFLIKERFVRTHVIKHTYFPDRRVGQHVVLYDKL